MGKKSKKDKRIQKSDDGEKRLTNEDIKIQNPSKFMWTEDDLNGLIWLDDHEYTGTVPPSS